MSSDPASFKASPAQASLIFGLLARHGEARDAELKPKPTPEERVQLVAARLLGERKAGRATLLTLEDAGWAWAGANLGAELPAAQRTLQELLARLGAYLERSGETLAEVIGSRPAPAPGAAEAATRTTRARKAPSDEERLAKAEAKRRAAEDKAAKADEAKRARAAEAEDARRAKADQKAQAAAEKASGGAPAARKRAPAPAAMRKRIDAAYFDITGGERDQSVRLALLRDKLRDLDPAAVDAALGRILAGQHPKATLMRHDDPRQVGPADTEAAYSPAGEPFHVLWISS